MRRAFSFLGLVIGMFSGTAHAQSPTSTTDPGRIDGRFQSPPTPQSMPEPVVFPEPEFGTPSDAGQTHFVLEGVEIEGATVFPAADLASIYTPLLHKDVSLTDLYRVRDRITATYRGQGYILSQALIPPQSISGGIVHIRVIEGSVGKVSFEGPVAGDPVARATASRVTGSHPLAARDLERTALLIGDIPGVTVHTTLKPSDTQGQADLVVTSERKRIEFTLFADNRGSVAIGPFEFGGSLVVNGLTGPDSLSLLYASTSPTSELRYVASSYRRVLSPSGLALNLSVSDSRSHPGGALAVLGPLGVGTIGTVGFSQPLIRTRAKSLHLDASFTVQDTRTDLLATTFAKDHVRYVTAGLTYDVSDMWLGQPASSLVRIEVSQGINVFKATPSGTANLSRANGRSDFTLASAEIDRVQRLGGPFSLALSASGQVGFVPLLSSQQFGLGGKRFGRGYEPSELTGDSGVAFSIEPRVDVPVAGAQLQVYAFYDVGEIWDKRPLAGAPSSQSLSSAGGGVRARIGDHLSFGFELAKPLTRDIASRANRDWRPLFDVSLHF